jgi:hypothetical protein
MRLTKLRPARFFLIAFAAFFLTRAFPQNSKIESVKVLLPNLSNDSGKVKTLVFPDNEYRKPGDSLVLLNVKESYRLAAVLGYYKGRARGTSE